MLNLKIHAKKVKITKIRQKYKKGKKCMFNLKIQMHFHFRFFTIFLPRRYLIFPLQTPPTSPRTGKRTGTRATRTPSTHTSPLPLRPFLPATPRPSRTPISQWTTPLYRFLEKL